jgi:hypothetical protein
MNIYAESGDKITYCNPNSGYQYDQEKAAKYLTLGNTYTIDYTDVSGWRTDVYIQEFPEISFNSVMFEDI